MADFIFICHIILTQNNFPEITYVEIKVQKHTYMQAL